MIALRIILIVAIVAIIIYVCLEHAPTVGNNLRELWNRLTGRTEDLKDSE